MLVSMIEKTNVPDSEVIKTNIQSLYRQLLKALDLVPRWGQKKMIATIANHLLSIRQNIDGSRFDENPAVVIEAGTGTGKTLSYMVACLPIAQALHKKLVISTATIALQEQIMNKDLPALACHGGITFDFQLAKGRGRYLCVARLHQALSKHDTSGHTLALFADTLALQLASQQQVLYQDMLRELDVGKWDGDRDNWASPVPNDYWQPVTTDHRGCSNRRCSFFNDCPFFKARAVFGASGLYCD